MPTIIKVQTPAYGKIIVHTSDGATYEANLTGLSHINRFPKDEADWAKVRIDSYGISLIWPSQLQLHMGQIKQHSQQSE